VFLTGASGVIGRALVSRLRDVDLLCLTRQNNVSGEHVTLLPGDVSLPRLGLQPGLYDSIARQIDCVVHSAAATGFNQPRELLERTNVDGTRNVLELAATADAPLYHLSTAFVRPEARWPDGFNPYESSKRQAEELLASAQDRVVVIRPSLVIGDSRTGEIARFGGFYLVLRLFLRGYLPLVPADPDACADFVPQDLVAEAIASLVEQGITTGEYWLTAGDRRLRIRDLAQVCVDFAQAAGHTLDYPKFVSEETFERLIRPVFLPSLPVPVRRTLESVLELLKYFNIARPFPSSFAELEQKGMTPCLPPPADALQSSLRYWADASGYRRRQAHPDSTDAELLSPATKGNR
jgi:thioester reductase-like protein